MQSYMSSYILKELHTQKATYSNNCFKRLQNLEEKSISTITTKENYTVSLTWDKFEDQYVYQRVNYKLQYTKRISSYISKLLINCTILFRRVVYLNVNISLLDCSYAYFLFYNFLKSFQGTAI